MPDDLCDIPIILKKDTFGVAFDLLDIASAGFTLQNSRKAPRGTLNEPEEEDMLQAVASCLSTFVMNSSLDRLSERVAHAFGCSPRTYRRKLAQLGTSHAKLLSDVRLDLALTFLEDDRALLADIAVDLGYAHSVDFTRFFKNRMGCSPSEYRTRRLHV